MGITQFDIIRQQAEAAAKNAVSRASASLRRDTSLVNQASRLTGKAIREGEAAVKRAAGRDRRRTAGEPRATAAADRPRPRQAAETANHTSARRGPRGFSARPLFPSFSGPEGGPAAQKAIVLSRFLCYNRLNKYA